MVELLPQLCTAQQSLWNINNASYIKHASIMCVHASPLELLSLRIPKCPQTGDWGVFLPGKYQKDCYCQSHWWCYILNGWRTRGSPVGGGCQWGGALWNLQGATETAEEKEKRMGLQFELRTSRHLQLWCCALLQSTEHQERLPATDLKLFNIVLLTKFTKC